MITAAPPPVTVTATDGYVPAAHVREVAPWLEVARDAFPASTCNGRVTVRVLAPGTVPAPTTGPDHAAGSAYLDGSCRVDLDASVLSTPAGACQIVTHELGHLAGRGHSRDASSVMAGSLSVGSATCAAAFGPRVAASWAAHALRARLPVRTCQRGGFVETCPARVRCAGAGAGVVCSTVDRRTGQRRRYAWHATPAGWRNNR